MFVFLKGECQTLSEGKKNPLDPDKVTALVAGFEEDRAVISHLFEGNHPADDKTIGAKYENLEGFDRIIINSPYPINKGEKGRVETEVYISQRHLAIFSQDSVLKENLVEYISNNKNEYSSAEVLKKMFAHMFSGDAAQLNKIEDSLAELETLVVEDKGKDLDFTKKILKTRKILLMFNRYYSAMFDLLEDLEENLNSIFTKEQIKHFRIHTNKADRLLGEINHLQEYATQVRDAYQNQLDIKQNKVMQFFTVITTIFLPLTLIAGWYGMNFKMPEYDYSISYPIVVVLSVFTVLGLLIYFKNKKWF